MIIAVKPDKPIAVFTIVFAATAPAMAQVPPGAPPLPPGGLPAGWTMEQWAYYGHQYQQ